MRLRVLALVTVGAVGALPSAGWALWSAPAAGSATVGADTMTNAAGFQAVCSAVKNNDDMVLSWVASPDAYVSGYELVRSGSDATRVTTAVPGRLTTTATVSLTQQQRKSVAFTFTIRALSSTTRWSTSALASPSVPSYDQRGVCTTTNP